jgi:septal ring factor EnvC (AmiA/AmiB activator)
MAPHDLLSKMILGAALLGAPMAMSAATPHAAVHAQLKDVDAKVAAARAHQTALQSQVTTLEQQNAAQQKQLQDRDAEIAVLQRKLQAAGVPAASASAGH